MLITLQKNWTHPHKLMIKTETIYVLIDRYSISVDEFFMATRKVNKNPNIIGNILLKLWNEKLTGTS